MLLMENIAVYFSSFTKLYKGRTNDIQIIIEGVELWDNIIFKHFDKYPVYGTKNDKLKKLLLIRELKVKNKHLI